MIYFVGEGGSGVDASLGRSLETQLAAEAVSFADRAATKDWAKGLTAFAEKRATESATVDCLFLRAGVVAKFYSNQVNHSI